MNDQMKEAFEVGALAQELVELTNQATDNDVVRFKAMTLALVAIFSTRGVSVDEMCSLIREITAETKRGAMVKETAQ